MPKRSGGSPRYEEIAVDLARKITEHELQEGDRILGRSSLAGQYKVSPETIRRAIAILHEAGVVRAMPGSGIRVVSRRLAAEFLDSLKTHTAMEEVRDELTALLAERRKLDERIQELNNRLVALVGQAMEAARRVEEVAVPGGSWLVGQSLASSQLRNLTGATVVGIVRGQHVYYSPPADMVLEAGDLLIIVGPEGARAKIEWAAAQAERPSS